MQNTAASAAARQLEISAQKKGKMLHKPENVV